jgi:hypothetical protein
MNVKFWNNLDTHKGEDSNLADYYTKHHPPDMRKKYIHSKNTTSGSALQLVHGQGHGEGVLIPVPDGFPDQSSHSLGSTIPAGLVCQLTMLAALAALI